MPSERVAQVCKKWTTCLKAKNGEYAHLVEILNAFAASEAPLVSGYWIDIQ